MVIRCEYVPFKKVATQNLIIRAPGHALFLLCVSPALNTFFYWCPFVSETEILSMNQAKSKACNEQALSKDALHCLN